MGQKVNPHGLRVGIIKQWDARWYADKKTFSDFLVEDKKIREFVKTEIDSIIKSSGKNSKKRAYWGGCQQQNGENHRGCSGP